jgi:hypothetical protein
VAAIDRCLQRLGDTDPDWEQSCSTRRGVNTVLQHYYHVLQERRHQARQTTLLSYFKKKSVFITGDAENVPHQVRFIPYTFYQILAHTL